MNKTHIVTISDTHGLHRNIDIPDGDVIIHAGDFSSQGFKHEIDDFLDWYGSLPHTWKILIAGNHDKGTDRDKESRPAYKGLPDYFEKYCNTSDIMLLNDDYCEVITNDGEIIKIWGSPVQPTFGYGWAWNRDRGKEIKKHWDKIPNGMDIITTHGPAFEYGDRVLYSKYSGLDRVGCQDLRIALEKVKPKMHVFGHIHEDRGVFIDEDTGITYVNTSSLTLRYKPYLSKTYRFDWDKVKKGTSIGQDYE